MANDQAQTQGNGAAQAPFQPSVTNSPTSVASGSTTPPVSTSPVEGVSNPPNNGQVTDTGADNEFVDNPSYKPSPEDSEFVDNPAYNGGKPKKSMLATAEDKFAAEHAAGVPWAGWKEGGVELAEIPEGIGEGVLSTVAGASDIAHLPQQVRDFLHNVAGTNEEQNGLETAGKGGETIAEFILTDGALKTLPMVKRLEVAAKAMKTIQGSPKLANALRVGAKVLAVAGIHGAEAGTVQAAQTAVRTGGDLKEAGKEGLEAAAIGGGLDVPLQGLGELAQKAGETATGVKNLANVAEGAKGKQEIVDELGARIKSAHAQMNADFEDAVKSPTNPNSIYNRLQGQEINAQDNPMAAKAKELLAEPVPEEHPAVKTAQLAAGVKLDKTTKDLLEQIANGTIPEEKAAEPATAKVLGFGEPAAKPTKSLAVPKTAPPYTIENLINLRQAIRKASAEYETGDINARVLRELNDSVDDTIGKMAANSGDQTALQDYQAARAKYREKVNVFNDPVIKNIRDGKVDDAAKAFVGVIRSGSALPSSGKVTYNLENLRRIIGDDGVHAFGKDVFNTMLKDSVEAKGANEVAQGGRFNPAKFTQTWERISDATKDQLFDIHTAENGLNALAKDAAAGATLQHLTRLGVLGTIGVAAGSHFHLVGMGLGASIGMTIAEGGYMQRGRDLLNYIATNPAVWNAYEKAGKVAAKSSGITPQIVGAAATDILNKKPSRDVYSDTENSLSGKQ